MPDLPYPPPVADVHGTNTRRGADLREAFSRALTRTKGGAQFVVARRGEIVVDVSGGGIDSDTPVQVFSISKLIVALAAAHAHDAGVLDLDRPLAAYWPEFDRGSTREITARSILDHSSGINGVDRRLDVAELIDGALEREVARQEPRWAPGTDHGYHAFTFGALLAGVFEHGAGVRVQDYAHDHIIAPAGGGFWFGAPDHLLPRLARLTFDATVLTEAQASAVRDGRQQPDGAMFPIMTDAPGFFSDPAVQQAHWPAMSGVSSAGALVRILSAALGYGIAAPLIPAGALDDMIEVRQDGFDRTMQHVSRFGSGVELPHPHFPYLGGRSFGHQGAGGAALVADPESGLVAAYVSTHTAATVGGSDAAIALFAAIRQSFEED